MLHQSLVFFSEVDMRRIMYNSGHILKSIQNIQHNWRLQNCYQPKYSKQKRKICLYHCGMVTWHPGFWSTLVLILACFLMTSYRYQNKCWLIIKMVQWHSTEDNSAKCARYLSQNCIWKLNIKNHSCTSQGPITTAIVINYRDFLIFRWYDLSTCCQKHCWLESPYHMVQCDELLYTS